MLLSKLKPILGLGLMVLREGRVLLAKRKGALGFGEYGFPGGKVEGGENLAEGALRELAEECGAALKVTNVRFVLVSNVRDYKGKHYVQIGFAADWVSGEAENVEPQRQEDWAWFALEKLPQPLFLPTVNLLEAYKSGENYKDE